jgi:serine/threonine protein kinase
MRQFQFFGPFPPNYHEIVDRDTIEVVLWFMEKFSNDDMIYFQRITEKQISKEDNEFICWIMKLDLRQRPTVRQILEHEWFKDDGDWMNTQLALRPRMEFI